MYRKELNNLLKNYNEIPAQIGDIKKTIFAINNNNIDTLEAVCISDINIRSSSKSSKTEYSILKKLEKIEELETEAYILNCKIRVIEKVINALSERHQKYFKLKYIDKLSNKQITKTMYLSIPTINLLRNDILDRLELVLY